MKYTNTGQTDIRSEYRFFVCGQPAIFDFSQKICYNIYVIKNRKEKIMSNYVARNYTYEEVRCLSSEKTVEAFELIMNHIKERVDHNKKAINYTYYASDFNEITGTTITPSVLTALVRRGLLIVAGKTKNRNYYSISQEIYDYYVNTYITTKKAYYDEMEEIYSKNRRKTQRKSNEERRENCAQIHF